MEELQSTETLDREIIEEAKKKASRILKQAEDAINAQNEKWEKKLNDSILEQNKKYSEQKEQTKKNIMARLPVDKLRLKIEKTEEHLRNAAESWYKTLSRQKINELLINELTKQMEFCADYFKENEEVSIQINGLDQNEAESILNTIKRVGGLNINNQNINYPPDKTPGALLDLPSVTIETLDVRITASIKNTIDFLLQEKRRELLSALVGNDFLGEM